MRSGKCRESNLPDCDRSSRSGDVIGQYYNPCALNSYAGRLPAVTDQLNVRARRSVIRRLDQATLILCAESGHRISKGSISKEPLPNFLTQRGIR